MNIPFLFFLVATVIVLLNVVVLNTGPVINGHLSSFKQLNCLMKSDIYEQQKTDLPEETDQQKTDKENKLSSLKIQKNSCYKQKAMYGLEYSAFIIDIIVGFICSLLGLLHYLEEGKDFVPKTGLIGLILGCIGFIINLVYIIFNGLTYSTANQDVIKTDENNIFAKWDNEHSVYNCLFYEENNEEAVFAKYSELGKKQYNYNKDIYETFEYDHNSEICKCEKDISAVDIISKCTTNKISSKQGDCLQLYLKPTGGIINKDLNNRWLTTLILSIIILLCTICLSFLGFLLFKNKGDSKSVEIV